jgi:MYXO-CTERM domain-containing protein
MVDPSPSPRFRSRGSFGGAALLAAALLAGGCSGGEAEESLGARQAIAGGTVDLSHHNVFLLISHLGDSGGLCTATLIAPNLLLTARHCVSPSSEDGFVRCGDSMLGEPFAPSSFLATNDPRPGRDSLFFRAVDVRVPGEGVDTCGYDIALITLSENVPSTVSTPAVPRIDRDVQPGEKYTAVGYGVDENGDSNGSRMQLSGLSIACQPGSCGEGVESTEFRGETGICSGDSGGPALDVDGKVVGVVSRGGPDCSTPVYGTVTAWRDFIIETALEAARVGNYDPPFWVTTRSSEPPPPVDGAGGGVSESPRGAEGDECRSGGECADGLVCFGDGTGVCRATCAATAECGAGQVCEEVGGDVSICLEPSSSADDSGGCSFGPGAPKSAGLAAALLGVLGALRRRARRK